MSVGLGGPEHLEIFGWIKTHQLVLAGLDQHAFSAHPRSGSGGSRQIDTGDHLQIGGTEQLERAIGCRQHHAALVHQRVTVERGIELDLADGIEVWRGSRPVLEPDQFSTAIKYQQVLAVDPDGLLPSPLLPTLDWCRELTSRSLSGPACHQLQSTWQRSHDSALGQNWRSLQRFLLQVDLLFDRADGIEDPHPRLRQTAPDRDTSVRESHRVEGRGQSDRQPQFALDTGLEPRRFQFVLADMKQPPGFGQAQQQPVAHPLAFDQPGPHDGQPVRDHLGRGIPFDPCEDDR